MKLDISKQMLQKIAIGVVLLIVLIFIVMRIWRSSQYKYPNAAETTVYTIPSAPTSSGGTLTFPVTNGFSPGDLVYIKGVSGVTFYQSVPSASLPSGAGSSLSGGTAVYITAATPTSFSVRGSFSLTTITGTYPTTTGFTAGTVTLTQGASTATATAAVGANGLTGLTGVTPTAGSLASGTSTTITQGSTTAPFTPTITFAVPTVASATVQSVVIESATAVGNTDLVTCQTQYATDLISSSSTLTPATAQTLTAASRTLNVTSSGGFVAGDKVLIPGVVDSANKAVVLEVESVPAGGTSLIFTGTSMGTMASGSVLPQTAVSNITSAYNKRAICVNNAAKNYTQGHCRYLPQQSTNRPIIPTQTDDPIAFAAYNQYQIDVNSIQTAYARIISSIQQNQAFPASGLTGTTFTQAQSLTIVEAARKADLANATQKYLATACPGFYALTTGSTTNDPSDEYKAWAVVTSDPTSSATSSAKKFWDKGVTDANIMKWAQGAGVVTLSGPVSSVTIPAGGIGSGYTTTAPSVTFSDPPSGASNRATGTAVIASGKITGVTILSGGSGYTTAPTITFGSVSGATAPTTTELATISVQISGTLSASAGLVTAGSYTSGGIATPYTTDRYTKGSGDNVNWRVAYKNGPGTYPQLFSTYAS